MKIDLNYFTETPNFFKQEYAICWLAANVGSRVGQGCKKGRYVILRHNSLRDLLAELLEEICKDVVTEPPLLPLSGEKLPPGSNLSDGARLDVSCINLWAPLSRAFIY